MSNTLSHVEFAQAYEQWKNRGWDSSVQAFAEQINDIPNRKRIDWLLNSEVAYDRLVSFGAPDLFLEQLFDGVYDDDIELWLHPELEEVVPEPEPEEIPEVTPEPEPPVEDIEPPIEDDGSEDFPLDDVIEDVPYLDN